MQIAHPLKVVVVAMAAAALTACSAALMAPATITAAPNRPDLAYQECVLDGVSKGAATDETISTAEGACKAQLAAYRNQYVKLGASAQVADKGVNQLVADTRELAKNSKS